jgi:hypothetical protein
MTIATMKALIAERASKSKPLIAELLAVVRDDSKPLEYRQRRERELRAAIAGVNDDYGRRIGEAGVAAAKEPQKRMAAGSALKADQLAEIPLLVEQYRGQPKQIQAQLVVEIGADLAAGAADRALMKARAARALSIPLGQLGPALAKADPVQRDARDELDVIEGLAQLALAEPVRELAHAGLGSSMERTAAKAFAADRGLRPDVPFPAQIEPGYAGVTVEAHGFPNAPFPEPNDPERDRQRERAERLRDNGDPAAGAAARYAARVRDS